MQNQPQPQPPKIHRILDANLNRLREALRVIEEYFRFISEDEAVSVDIKRMRHEVAGMESALGTRFLLAGRDTEADCFASVTRPEEMDRGGGAVDVLSANFKRAQEACRVIEEYAKACGGGDGYGGGDGVGVGAGVSRRAKEIRFLLYGMQKFALLPPQ